MWYTSAPAGGVGMQNQSSIQTLRSYQSEGVEPEQDYETPACVVCGARPLEVFLILVLRRGATHIRAAKYKCLNHHSLMH